ncbi:MAG: VWA domain-containing protein [Kiritimatiellae bacterium]|nr:VWA domain-containing protein [Kiritimatiellia bacterium]
MITWGHPQAMWALAAWAAMSAVCVVLYRRGRRIRSRLAEAGLWAALAPGYQPRHGARRLAIWIAASGLAVGALARPQWGFRWEEVRQEGVDWMIVLDVSNSMLAPDFRPSRMQQAQWAIRDLVRSLNGDRIGLTAFAGEAFLHCPLTSDYGAFLMMLDEIRPGVIPRGGTAIEVALDTAAKAIDHPEGAVMILITDGEDHEGDARAAAARLTEKGIRLQVIGVGSTEGELIPMETAGGFLKNRSGDVVKSRLDEAALSALATAGGGGYVRAAPGDFGLEGVMARLRPSVTVTEGEARMRKVPEERFAWLLFAALALFLLEALSPQRDRTPSDRARGWGRRRKAPAAAALAVWAVWGGFIGSADAARSPAASLRAGSEAQAQGNLEQADAAYVEASAAARERKQPGLAARAEFNSGTVRDALGRPEDAASQWRSAAGSGTADPEAATSALYNLGVAAMNRAMAAEEKNEGPVARTQWNEARSMLISSLLAGATGEDVRYNLEYCQTRHAALDGLVAAAEAAVSEADAAMDRGAFADAKAALDRVAERRELLFSLKPALKEVLERLDQRLPPIIQIQQETSGASK